MIYFATANPGGYASNLNERREREIEEKQKDYRIIDELFLELWTGGLYPKV